jgi:hypothetical protein
MSTVQIPLTQGKVALIDEVDYGLVIRHKWFAVRHGNGCYYATTKVHDGVYPAITSVGRRTGPDRRCALGMHRLIMAAPVGTDVDHISGDTLDNRRANLRLASTAENKANGGRYACNQSGYKGVYFHKRWRYWQAQIRHDGLCYTLGNFEDALSAARAYDEAARRLHGPFARLNFPESD